MRIQLNPRATQRRGQPPKRFDLRSQIHGELFSVERLEEFAREMAAQHKGSTRRVPPMRLLVEVERDTDTLQTAYSRLSEAARR
ncbi:MAG: hypothetical protein ACJ78Q_01735, partial [Chloroflexia bacterium]